MDYPVYRCVRDIPGTPEYRASIEKPDPIDRTDDPVMAVCCFAVCVVALLQFFGVLP
jgi:hypothetical protein